MESYQDNDDAGSDWEPLPLPFENDRRENTMILSDVDPSEALSFKWTQEDVISPEEGIADWTLPQWLAPASTDVEWQLGDVKAEQLPLVLDGCDGPERCSFKEG